VRLQSNSYLMDLDSIRICKLKEMNKFKIKWLVYMVTSHPIITTAIFRGRNYSLFAARLVSALQRRKEAI
jgi:hypothetical protein